MERIGPLLPNILALAHRDLGEKDRTAASALLACVLLLGNDVGLSAFPIIIDVATRVYIVATGYFVVFIIQTVLVVAMLPTSILDLKGGASMGDPGQELRTIAQSKAVTTVVHAPDMTILRRQMEPKVTAACHERPKWSNSGRYRTLEAARGGR